MFSLASYVVTISFVLAAYMVGVGTSKQSKLGVQGRKRRLVGKATPVRATGGAVGLVSVV